MSTEKATAIVLRVVEFSETSSVVTLFSREFGKFGALAKGARRPKGPFESALDLLSLVRVVFLRKSHDALDLLTEAKLERRFRPQARELSSLYAGYYVAELLSELTHEYDPFPDLFDAAEQTLAALSRSERVAEWVLRFELTALRAVGHLPSWGACAECGRELSAVKRVAFSQAAGGVLCEKCRVGKKQLISVSTRVAQILSQYSDPNEQVWQQISLERAVRGEIRGLMNHYFNHLIGRRLQMQNYLRTLALVILSALDDLRMFSRTGNSVYCLLLGCCLTAAGCTSTTGASKPHKNYDDPYEGWLYKRMTGQPEPDDGRRTAATAAAEAEAKATAHTGPVSLPTAGAGGPSLTAPANSPQPGVSAVPESIENLRQRYPELRIEEPKKSDGADFGPFSSDAIANSYKKLVGQSPNHEEARRLMGEGEVAFRQAKYSEAADLFKKAGIKWPDSALEEDALFLRGECYFFTDLYSKANDVFSDILTRYPNSRYLDRIVARQFSIALYWQQSYEKDPHWPVTPNFTDKTRPWFDAQGYAISTWDQIRQKDPLGPLADDAVMATGNAFFLKGRYEDADYYYTLLRRDFPKCEHQVQAHLLALQCKVLKYQGPDYDAAPLKEAEELVDQMLKQFPTELAGERERLLKARTDVRSQLAYRDWQRAEYYAAGEHYAAARYYYNTVVKDYPQSNLAQLAQSKIGEYNGKPDNPEDRFAFLTKYFNNSNDPNIRTAKQSTGTTQR